MYGPLTCWYMVHGAKYLVYTNEGEYVEYRVPVLESSPGTGCASNLLVTAS